MTDLWLFMTLMDWEREWKMKWQMSQGNQRVRTHWLKQSIAFGALCPFPLAFYKGCDIHPGE